MKITRKKITATTQSVNSATTEEMIEAFESRLDELGVESKTDLSCKSSVIEDCGSIYGEQDIFGDKSVYIDDSDYDQYYVDSTGMFGQDGYSAGETYSLGEIKNYWNQNYDSDYVLEAYDTFDDWWNDTKPYMDEYFD